MGKKAFSSILPWCLDLQPNLANEEAPFFIKPLFFSNFKQTTNSLITNLWQKNKIFYKTYKVLQDMTVVLDVMVSKYHIITSIFVAKLPYLINIVSLSSDCCFK